MPDPLIHNPSTCSFSADNLPLDEALTVWGGLPFCMRWRTACVSDYSAWMVVVSQLRAQQEERVQRGRDWGGVCLHCVPYQALASIVARFIGFPGPVEELSVSVDYRNDT